MAPASEGCLCSADVYWFLFLSKPNRINGPMGAKLSGFLSCHWLIKPCEKADVSSSLARAWLTPHTPDTIYYWGRPQLSPTWDSGGRQWGDPPTDSQVQTKKMTATDQMRAMLDQLMGTSRNGKWSSLAHPRSPAQKWEELVNVETHNKHLYLIVQSMENWQIKLRFRQGVETFLF